MQINYYILIELLIIDLIFVSLIFRYLKVNKLQKLVDKKERKISYHDIIKTNYNSKTKLIKKILQIIKKRIDSDRVVFEKEKEFNRYIFLQYLLPIILFVFVLIEFHKTLFPTILLPVLYYSSNRIKFQKIKTQKQLSFQKNTYKIYKFINNQVSSGVRPHDCIMGLYDVIEDKSFKKTLINMSAIYSQTSDIDLSLESVLKVYPGIDAIMLCSAIKQGVCIGSNIETIERQEKLAFNKYFAYIKNETEKIKFKGYLSISMFAFIIILLVSIPLLYEMKEATTKIFIN